ncbi:Variant surface glycoprotein [Trypanosoma congolense IL3000]|uniref:Variant surface glycoprotein n=1 Tax=Trypanosoma congolense (strain IL3000) TaxID=1068625 RepID=F9WC35_TRYCI|nr:Variant surface glycoprotein [Trypanosoma congolense IL3000]
MLLKDLIVISSFPSPFHIKINISVPIFSKHEKCKKNVRNLLIHVLTFFLRTFSSEHQRMKFKSMSMIAMVIVASGNFINSRAAEISDHNKEEKELLCDVLKATQGILSNTGHTHEKELKEAIYGSPEKNYRFGASGSVVEGKTCIFDNLRQQLCTYRSNEGCYAQSLIGAFFCLCTPGSLGRGTPSLCGATVVNYGQKGWWGQWKDGEHAELFKKVWKNVVENCTRSPDVRGSYAGRLQALGEAVKRVREKIKKNKNSGSLYSLGEGSKGECSGTSAESVCAAYTHRQTKDSELDIPWADTIESILKKLRLNAQDRQIVDPRQPEKPSGVEDTNSIKHEVSQPSTSENKGKTQEGDKKDKETQTQTKIVGRLSTSEGEQARKRRRTPTSDKTSIESLATGVAKDGYFLKKPNWLLVGTLLN